MRGRRWRRMKSVMSFPPVRSVRRKDLYTIATISGEIDIARTPVLREQLLGLLRPGASPLVVDLSGVTFCDASELAVLVGIARRAGLLGGILRLAAPTPLMSTVLRLTGLDSRFEIFATVLEAIGAPVARASAMQTCSRRRRACQPERGRRPGPAFPWRRPAGPRAARRFPAARQLTVAGTPQSRSLCHCPATASAGQRWAKLVSRRGTAAYPEGSGER